MTTDVCKHKYIGMVYGLSLFVEFAESRDQRDIEKVVLELLSDANEVFALKNESPFRTIWRGIKKLTQ